MSDKFCILQDDLKDCGICCLLSIIKYYHGDVSKEYLREETKTNNNGVNALNLLKCARKLGFEAYGIKGKISDINIKFLPVIAHVVINKKYSHFVVIYKLNVAKNKILVMDPAKGFGYYLKDDFLKISTGYYLILKPKQSIPKLKNDSHYFDKIKKIIFDYKSIFLLVLFLSFFFTIINIIGSYSFKLLYESNNSINVVFLFLSILITIKCVISYFRNHLLIMFNTILDKFLVSDAFYHIINLPYLYYRNHTNGDLIKRINDLGNIKELLSNLFVSFFVDITLAIVIFVFMFNINSNLSLLSILFLFIYGVISLISSKNIKNIIHNSYEHSAVVNNDLIEALASFETIKNLFIQNYIYHKFVKKYHQYIDVNEGLFKRIQIELLFKNTIMELGNLFIIYRGIRIINHGITITSLIAFITLSNYLMEPIKKLLALHLEYQNTKESIRRIKELYLVSKEDILLSQRSIKYLSGSIDINNVSYSYNGNQNVINNLSLNIQEGEKVLLYGNSGSGKSTLMQLLVKYIDNNYQGNITVGGYDLLDIDLYTLRNNICYVSQNEYLYTDSIYENITLGKKIKYSLFLDLVNNLNINEIIKNSSLGYNLIIENNGENISGGERKKILVARSILRKANIYIYDETFSEMDIILERKVLNYLFKKFPDKTFIIISHRYSNEDLFSKTIKIGGEDNDFIKRSLQS